jgi:S1-C subfamily serine protease
VKLTERPLPDSGEGTPAPARRSEGTAPGEPGLGLVVREMDAGFARRLEIPSSVHGVVVVRIDPVGPAFVPALRRGFVIMEINRQPVRSVAEFERIIAAARTGDALAFYGYDPSVGQKEIVMATVDAR